MYTVPNGITLASPVKRRVHDAVVPASRPKWGSIPIVRRENVTRAIFLTDKAQGMPPGSGFDPNDEGENPITPSWPEYTVVLRNEGYKNRGVGTLLDYPGGHAAYFNRFCVSIIRNSIALAVDPDYVTTQPYWTMNWTPRSETLAMMAAYDGIILLNTEHYYPMTSWFWYSGPGRSTGSWYYIFRKRLTALLGRTPTDQELSDRYYQEVIYGLAMRTILEIKKLCPRARISAYGWPNEVPIFASWPLSSIGHTEQMAEINSGKLDLFYAILGSVSPIRALPYIVLPDGQPVGTNQVGYTTMLGYNQPSDERVKALQRRTGCSINVWVRGRNAAGTVYSETEARYVCDAINACCANEITIWGESGKEIIEASMAVLNPFLLGITRTDPPANT